MLIEQSHEWMIVSMLTVVVVVMVVQEITYLEMDEWMEVRNG